MFLNSRKKLSLFLLGGFSLLAGLILIVTATVGGTALRASVENYHTANHYVRRVSNDALFTTSGVNQTVALALVNAINNTAVGTNGARTAKNFSDFASNGVAQINGALYIRLFDTLGDIGQVNGTETTPLNAFTNSVTDTGANFVGGGARWWRVVYERDGILTLYMSEPYRKSTYHTLNNVYSTSTVRTNLLDDFNVILSYFPYVNSHIALGGQSWQNGIADFDNATNRAPTNDKIWLPSWYEVIRMNGETPPSLISSGDLTNNGVRTGLWEMNGFDRGYSSVFWQYAWLRSGRVDNEHVTYSVSTEGNATNINSLGTNAVRPAIHLSLDSILPNYTVALPPQSGTGWVLVS